MPANIDKEITKQPKNSKSRIWRYMDLAKFISLLCDSSIYFCQVDLLGDEFEGSITEENWSEYLERYEANPSGVASPDTELWRTMRKHIYVNCWHMNNHESAAMWSLYGGNEGAIAVSTTYKKFANLLPKDVTLGLVSYIDYKSDLIPLKYAHTPCMYKRRSYSHEQEVRAVIINVPNKDGEKATRVPVGSPGVKIPLDLNTLINSIHISPKAPIWYKDILTDLTNQYGLKVELKHSSLNDSPLF